MPDQQRYRELVERIREAHRIHAKAYKAARMEFGTNRKAHDATAKELAGLHAALKLFYEGALRPLLEPFLAGKPAAIDEVLNFLEVDVAAFRTGYSKEWYYRKLKAMQLSAGQLERLRVIALNRCASSEYRREDSELRRLMIRIADVDFLRRVRGLPDGPNAYVKRKKTLMLEVILNGRTDLREANAVLVKK